MVEGPAAATRGLQPGRGAKAMAFLGLKELIRRLKSRHARRQPITAIVVAPASQPAPEPIMAANDDGFSGQAFDLEAALAAVDRDRFDFKNEPVEP